MRIRIIAFISLLLALGLGAGASAQQVKVEEFTLPNGMKFLLVPRDDQPNVIAAGWLAKVGSVNERPGITGLSHFFEHMMFKGTNTVGTKDAAKDTEYRDQQRQVHEKILELVWTVQYDRFKKGEIDDPWNPGNDTPELAELRAQLKRLMDEQAKETIVKNEFDSIYTKQGGSGMNAFTTNDVTFYFINVPSNKFELWAWMESDRLNDSVFREFYAERDVVHEERRLRTESTPTGIFEEQFDALFWQSSPYNWPVIGWTSDLNSYTMEEAQRYFNTYYRPNNLVSVIVGDFNPAQVKPLIESYFGRLKPGETAPPPVVTLEMPQKAEARFYAECDCQPEIEVRYHSVPFNHADSFALQMLAEVLNGRTGRLYKAMVEGKEIASSASASAGGLGGPAKYAGSFSFSGEVKGDAAPEQIEAAWYEEVAKLQNELIGEQELQKVKNRVAADAYRRLQSNFFLLLQLGYYEGLGGWQYINEAPRKLQTVTAEDLQRVAKKYFEPTNRSVAIYKRKAGSASEELPPELAGVDEQTRAGIMQTLRQLKAAKDPQRLQMFLTMMESQKGQASAEERPAVEYMIKKLKERIAELEAAPQE
jgi:predicted Zn-dependent peptidase